jgi:hypothetical protein
VVIPVLHFSGKGESLPPLINAQRPKSFFGAEDVEIARIGIRAKELPITIAVLQPIYNGLRAVWVDILFQIKRFIPIRRPIHPSRRTRRQLPVVQGVTRGDVHLPDGYGKHAIGVGSVNAGPSSHDHGPVVNCKRASRYEKVQTTNGECKE